MNAAAIATAQIGQLVTQVSTWNPARDTSDKEFLYVDLSSVDNQSKRIVGCQRLIGRRAPSRARQLVRSRDILVSTVRPNLNGVARVPHEFDGATASTGFCVLRPNKSALDGDYLFHWLISEGFVGDMVRKATGASYPAVSDRIIFESQIPLPPLAEQKRIAAILNQADELRRKRTIATLRLNELGQAIFYDMFGDPATNPKDWPLGTVDDLTASTRYGTSSKGGEVGALPILRMGNILPSGDWDFSDLKFIDLTNNDLDKFTIEDGDILFNRTNSPDLVGKAAVYRGGKRFAYAGYLIRLRVNEFASPEYIGTLLNSPYGKKTLRGMCKAIIGMANINAQELRTIPIPIAPINLQKLFRDKILAIRSLVPAHLSRREKLDALFLSLQHRAFRGELTSKAAERELAEAS